MNLEPANEPVPPTETAPESNRFDRLMFFGSVAVAVVVGLAAAVIAGKVSGVKPTTATAEQLAAATSLLPLPRPLADFQLVERSGRTVSRADLTNQFLVVNFAFTSCSLSCLAVNQRMADVQQLVATAPDVRLVSLSVDPLTDTPSALTKFADRFQADPERWLFLTGEKAGLYRLIETSFIARSPELTGLVPGGFGHTDRIMLVDPQGNVCASFNGMKTNVASLVVAEITKRRGKS